MEHGPNDGPADPSSGAADGAKPDPRAAAGVRAIVFLYRRFERACRDEGLSLPQYRLLLFLRHGPRRAGELAARAAIQRPTLTSLVDGLEKEGRLRRVQVEADRRGVRLELTAVGTEALVSAEARLSGIVDELCAREGEVERDRLLDAFRTLAGLVEQEVEERLER